MAKPAGARCNLACRYCYYLEKRRLYPGDNGTMDDSLLELFTRQYIDAQTGRETLFTWHGGEPLLLPLSFYRRALSLQRRYGRGRTTDNCIQTNGTLLTDEWCAFLADNNFLVGVSIDGPKEMHDTLRGETFDRVMDGIRKLDARHVQWNAMATVNKMNVGDPTAFYKFFKSIGCKYIQFTPVVERTDDSGRLLSGTDEGGTLTEASITPEQWGAFLCGLFDEWIKTDVGEVFVQLFDAVLACWAGVPPGICSLAPTCGHVAALEHNGDVYSCDHFVFPEYKLGNIRREPLTAMMYSSRQMLFGKRKSGSLPRQCRECAYLFTCHGECPKNRFARDRYGERGLNFLCDGYRTFFAHVTPYMDFMKDELAAGRAPANVMGAVFPTKTGNG